MITLITAVLVIAIVTLAGCGDEGELLFPVSPLATIEQVDFIGAPPLVNLNRPKLRVFYVEPKTQPIPPTAADYASYVERIDLRIKEAQVFFANEMTRHGYKGKTFGIDTHNGRLIVERYTLENSLNYYLTSPTHEVRLEISRELGNIFDHGTREIRMFFVDLPGHSACGFGSGNTTNGSAYVFGQCWTRSTIAHELGHAFGLQHDWRNGEFIMSYGSTRRGATDWTPVENPQTKISYGAAGWLNQHPAFNGWEVDTRTYSWIDNFEVVQVTKKADTKKHELRCTFHMEYFPKGHNLHDYSLNSMLNYAVFLDTTRGPNVVRFIGKNAFKRRIFSERILTDLGPTVVNRIEYEMRFDVEFPPEFEWFQMEFISKWGHSTIINAREWTH